MSDFEDKLMELKKRIEAGETEIEQVAKPEEVAEEPKVETEAEVAEPEKPVEAEEPPKEEVVDEKKAKVSAYQERKSKQAAKEVERLQAEVAAERAARLAIEAVMKQQPKQEEAVSYEADPDAALDKKLNTALSEIEAFKRERLVNDAVVEFQGHVKSLADDVPDVEKVIDAGFNTLCQSLALMNPGVNKAEVEKQAKMSILRIASTAMTKGENPAEAVYDHFTRNGIKVVNEAKQEKPSEAKKLEAVVKNKAKTGSPLAGGGASSSVALTKEAFMKMTPAEFYRLSPEERARLMS